MGTTVNSIKITRLKIFPLNDGSVYHAIKKNDPYINDFGEVYFSKINYKSIKGWKRHSKMTLNLVVPVGNVFFAFVDNDGKHRYEIIGVDNYIKLTIPPMIWFAFMGLDKPENLVMNFADLDYDPNEVEVKSLNEINFKFPKDK